MTEADAMISRRRLLRHAVPVAASVVAGGAALAASPPATPSIPPDLAVRMDAWRNAYREMGRLTSLQFMRGPDRRFVHPMMTTFGELTEFGVRVHDASAREELAREALLAAILEAPPL